MSALFVYCPRSQRAIKQKISPWSAPRRLHTLSGVSAHKKIELRKRREDSEKFLVRGSNCSTLLLSGHSN